MFVLDCDERVGWGHFTRCSALAAEFRSRGCDVTLVLNGEPPSFAGRELTIVPGGEVGDAAALERAGPAEIVVIDLASRADLGAEDLAGSALVVLIVDGGRPAIGADLVVDPNVGAVHGAGLKRLAGPRFVILRQAFDDLPSRELAPRPRRLLIAFGGTPRPQLIETTVAGLKRVVNCYEQIDVVAPTSIEFPRSELDGRNLRVDHAVSDMRQLLSSADVGVIAAGMTLHEACATGLPCAVVSLSDEQAAEARALAELGAIAYLGQGSQLSVKLVAQTLEDLTRVERRRELSACARRAIDGGGRARIVDSALGLARQKHAAARR